MNITIPTEQIAREIFDELSKLFEKQDGKHASDPLELLDMRDLVGELKMSVRSIKRRIASGEFPEAAGNNGIRNVWTRSQVNEVKLAMMYQGIQELER